MIRTQIQLPEELYKRLKKLAEVQETSLAEVIRRAGEREVAAHPELDGAPHNWEPPAPRELGIKPEVQSEHLRLLANEPPHN